MQLTLTSQMLSLWAISLFSGFVGADCFHPNGTAETDQYHAPCSSDPSNPLSSICCAVGRPVPDAGWAGLGLTRDVCLENGLCQNRKKAEEKDTNLIVWYWREECTEKNWQSGKCLNVCVDNVNGGNVAMTPCDGTPTSEKWCCGGDSKACCSINPIVLPKLGKKELASTSSASPQASSTAQSSITQSTNAPPSSTPSAATAPAQAETSNKSSSIGGGAIAGAVIGAIVAVVAIFAAGYMVARRKRTAPKGEMTTQPNSAYPRYEHVNENGTTDAGGYAYKAEAMGAPVYEAEATPHTSKYREKRGKIGELP